MNSSRGSLPISWQRITLIALCIILTLILAAMIFLTGYVHRLLNLVSGDGHSMNETLAPEHLATATEYNDPNFSGPVTEPFTQSTLPSAPIKDTEKDHIINILLIGEDRRPGQPRQRSDSMILCSFNTKTNTLTMVSFLRDTYISQIPGYWAEKLNASYCFGGAKTLNETLAAYFGVHVDANVAVQFDGFVGIIDMLGGVDINLTKKEVAHLNEVYASEGWNLRVGMNHLSGEQALAYSRIRKIDLDAMRAQRQRNVLTALINAYKSKPLGDMLNLTTRILETGFLETDMSTNDVLAYVKLLFPRLATCTINNMQIPAEGTYQNMKVGNIVDTKVCDLDINRLLLKRLFEDY